MGQNVRVCVFAVKVKIWTTVESPLVSSPATSIFLSQAVNESSYCGDDSVLKALVEIADTAPKYLRPNLEATLQLSLKVSRHANTAFDRNILRKNI